jgi:DNA-binding transcriptional LysR family regulator
MVPTAICQVFVQRANTILNEMRRATEEVAQAQGGISGNIVVGLSIAPHLALLPKILRPFYGRYPNVKLHIVEGSFATLNAGLRSGSIDFYVGPGPESAASPDLLLEKLFDNTRTILARKNHPLAGARSLGDLAGAEWATTSITSRQEEELGELFEGCGLQPPKLALRSQSALTLLVSLAYTDLLAMVPIQWTQFSLVGDALVPIHVVEAFQAPPIHLVRRAGLPLTPAAEYFADLVRRQVPHVSQIGK